MAFPSFLILLKKKLILNLEIDWIYDHTHFPFFFFFKNDVFQNLSDHGSSHASLGKREKWFPTAFSSFEFRVIILA